MLKIIAAVAANGVIGRGMKIPWKLRSDMDWFKRVTDNTWLLMGTATYFSFPEKFRPLPNRTNIVLTHNPKRFIESASGLTEVPYTPPEHEVVSPYEVLIKDTPVSATDSLEHARRAANSSHKDLFVIGGTEPYRLALPDADEFYLTRVHTQVEGDTFFPEWDESEWTLVWAQDNYQDERNEFDFSWEIYRRKYPARRSEHPYIETANIRTRHQRKVMQEILDAGHCPFCAENLQRWHKPRIIRQYDHWTLTYNQWPYPNTSHHFLLVLRSHTTCLSDISKGAGEEYFQILKDLEILYGIEGGATWMRFGEPIATGATVRHLHAQIVVPHPKAAAPTLIYVGSKTDPKL